MHAQQKLVLNILSHKEYLRFSVVFLCFCFYLTLFWLILFQDTCVWYVIATYDTVSVNLNTGMS